MTSKKAVIVMDKYKAETFRKNLKRSGFGFIEDNHKTNTILFTVMYATAQYDKLKVVVAKSNKQAVKEKVT